MDPEIGAVVRRRADAEGRAGVSGVSGLLGVEGELRLAGQGAFMVEEFAVAELAAALGLSEPAGRAYVGQAVELRDRLPLCWGRVMAGVLPAWKARQIAEQTIPLTGDAARWVDTHVSTCAHRLSLGRILTSVDAAVLRFDPAEAARRAEAAAGPTPSPTTPSAPGPHPWAAATASTRRHPTPSLTRPGMAGAAPGTSAA